MGLFIRAIMVDFNKKIVNSDKFRKSALTFQRTGRYCAYPANTSEFMRFWDEEQRRCVDGYTADDGDYITGYNYFYLNYCPIERIVYEDVVDKRGNPQKARRRKVEFPDFYDYDYYFFSSIEAAEDNGKHMCVLKSRRKGYSYKLASMACRNFYLIPNSKSYVYASDQGFLLGDGTFTKVGGYMSFIDKNTAFAKKKSINKSLHKRAGFITKDEFGNEVEMGYKSEIIGVSLKDDPNKVRGRAGKLIIFEEAGTFAELGAAWSIARPSVEQDGIAFGLMLASGCVCAGTKVWTASGNCVNVEDLSQEDGIIGWNTYCAAPQNISSFNPPAEKRCIRVTTDNHRTLECSIDHPLLWSTPGKTKYAGRINGKKEQKKSWEWKRADEVKVGEQVAIIDEIPFFGTKKMWEPRLVGWLIGDGSYGYDKTPRLSNCDKEILSYVESHFDTRTERERVTKDGRTYKEIRIKSICPKLRELGIYGQTRNKKRLPVNIHEYDKESLSELIGGLIDTDGHVQICRNGLVGVTLTQSHKEILEEVRDVLLHFGVHCRIRFIKPTGRTRTTRGRTIVDRNGQWVLDIRDVTSVCKFAEHFELTVGYKQAALDLIWLYSETHTSKYKKYLCGIHAEKILAIEDIGVKPIYNLTAKEYHNYIANGIVTHNTGGDDKGNNFTTLKDMFYHPDGYNCMSFPNIWDEHAEGTKCGFFCPQYSNLANQDEEGNRLYMDADGNTLHRAALDYILSLRKEVVENASNSATIDRYCAENCITPAEACLNFNGNIFPKKELQEQLSLLRTNKKLQNHKQVGDLIWGANGELLWQMKKTGDITHYPLKREDNPEGSIVIWEHPNTDANVGLYCAGCDPYDHDQSGTNSLGSCLIYKRIQGIEAYSDIIVAEYTGRPNSADEFYENVRKLLIYYNARLMYENQNKGLFVYFANKHCDYLLADQPDIISDIVSNSKVQRKKGCHMNKQIKQWGEGLIKDWLNDLNANGKKNLYNILSEPLLEELIAYNDMGNFDRVCALIQVMIYREQLYNIVVKEKTKENKANLLFDGPIFAQSWFEDEPNVSFDDNVYTF